MGSWDGERGDLHGYMAVSEVGRMAMGSSRSDWPLLQMSAKCRWQDRRDLRPGDPSDFRRESFYVVLFSLQDRRGHEHREVGILHTKLLDLCIEPGLNLLPDTIGPWLEDVTTADVVVLQHVCFEQDL